MLGGLSKRLCQNPVSANGWQQMPLLDGSSSERRHPTEGQGAVQGTRGEAKDILLRVPVQADTCPWHPCIPASRFSPTQA